MSINHSTALPYKVLAFDLDGTLTNHEKQVTPLTRQALLAAEARGAIIVLASGRPTYGIKPVADCLELYSRGGYILSYNGGKVVDCKTGNELYSAHLPAHVLPVIHQYSRRHGHALLGYAGNEILTERAEDEYVREEARINKMPVRQVDHLLEHLEDKPTKLLMTGHPHLMEAAEKELQQLLSADMEIYRSAPFFLELVPKGIDKAQSLLRLLENIHATPADLIAFGDGYNDLSMIELAAMGVAMDNAAEEVKAKANYVTASNEDDGVAAALRYFGF